jgi:hypothetical protein
MISYLGIAQDLTDSSVYARGVRLYLEGKVGRPVELDLEYWREYEVYDRVTYTVRLPILHYALKQSALDNAPHALTEFVSCGCEYFAEMGICKHIVAVCASLEQEFNPHQDEYIGETEKSTKQEDSSSLILDRIFEVEVDKKTKRWQHEFEAYLSQSGSKIPRNLQLMIGIINKDAHLYGEMITFIKKYSQEATTDYNKEKNLTRFILFTLHYNNPLWVEMWLGMLSSFDESNRRKIILELWIILKSGVKKEIRELFEIYLKNLSEEDKEYYIDQLKQIYTKNKDLWLDFVESSQAHQWIIDNYKDLDPLTLIRFAPLVPDLQEDIEISILNQLKQWGDFLQVGDYDEIIEVFHRWQKVLGRSSYYEEAVRYYKDTHSKKKKLISSIS